jgi:hypothetical protein
MLNKFLRIPTGLFFWIISGYILWRIWEILTSNITRFNNITWLISYDSGFTKRGLLGSIIRGVFGSQLSLQVIEIIAKFIFLAIVLIYFSLIFRYRKNNFVSLVLLLSPTLIMFPLNNMEMIGRIEQIGILVTVLNCFLIRYALKKFQKQRFLSSVNNHLNYAVMLTVATPVFLLSILLFAHEGILLLIAPSNFVLTFVFLCNAHPERNKMTSLLVTAAAYVPVGLSFLFILLYKNETSAHAYEICNNIKTAFPELISKDCSKLPHILKFHVKLFNDSISSSLKIYSNRLPVHMFYAGLGLALSYLSVISIAHVFHFEKSNKTLSEAYGKPQQPKNNNATFSENVSIIDNPTLTAIIFYFFILPFTCTIPMYIVAIDWGRWIAAINLQFVLVSLMFMKPDFLPLIAFPFSEKDTFMNAYNKFIFLSCIILLFLLVRLPHWARDLKKFVSPLAKLIGIGGS